MSTITQFTLALLLTTTLSACSFLQFSPTAGTKVCADDHGTFDTCKNIPTQFTETHKSTNHLFKTTLHFNRLSEYTEQMAADLQKDVLNHDVDQPIAVASFVNLDDSLQNTDTLGIQLAESFINDLQQIGLPVMDHKLTGQLNVNDRGDFVFSRDSSQLNNELKIGYVLTGTMKKNNRGLVVNARIINFKTNAVIASSSKFLPNLLIEDLL